MQMVIYKGKITNGGVGLTKELTFKNAKAALTDLQWMTNSGVKLEGSEVTVSGNDGSGRCWLEKLTMDEDSKLVLKNVSQGFELCQRCSGRKSRNNPGIPAKRLFYCK